MIEIFLISKIKVKIFIYEKKRLGNPMPSRSVKNINLIYFAYSGKFVAMNKSFSCFSVTADGDCAIKS